MESISVSFSLVNDDIDNFEIDKSLLYHWRTPTYGEIVLSFAESLKCSDIELWIVKARVNDKVEGLLVFVKHKPSYHRTVKEAHNQLVWCVANNNDRDVETELLRMLAQVSSRTNSILTAPSSAMFYTSELYERLSKVGFKKYPDREDFYIKMP